MSTTTPTVHAPKPVQVRLGVQDYAARKDVRERRSPITPHEWHEEEGWAKRVEETLAEMEKHAITHTLSDEERKEQAPLTQKDVQEKIKTCPKIKGNFMHKTKNGEIEAVFFEDAPSLVQPDPENASELARIPQWSNEELLKWGYSLYEPSSSDGRHNENYAKDQARCKEQGLRCGLQHFGCRRAEGHKDEAPALTKETLPAGTRNMVNKFAAMNRYVEHMAPNDQAIGQILSIVSPKEYAERRKVVEFWEERSHLSMMVKSKRQCYTMRANVVNMCVQPHHDNQPGMTASQVYGTYSGSEGAGMLYIPSFDRAFVFTERSLLLLRADTNCHGVGEWTEGTRCCMTHYTTADMYKMEDPKLPPYPEEIAATRAAAREKEAKDRVAKGEPATIDACPFCQTAEKGHSAVSGHLGRYMMGKVSDDKHPLDEVATWILNYDGRKPHAADKSKGIKRRAKSKGVLAAEEYRRAHPVAEVDETPAVHEGQGEEPEQRQESEPKEEVEQEVEQEVEREQLQEETRSQPKRKRKQSSTQSANDFNASGIPTNTNDEPTSPPRRQQQLRRSERDSMETREMQSSKRARPRHR